MKIDALLLVAPQDEQIAVDATAATAIDGLFTCDLVQEVYARA